jgi:flagellar biosynthesis regulator FlaF
MASGPGAYASEGFTAIKTARKDWDGERRKNQGVWQRIKKQYFKRAAWSRFLSDLEKPPAQPEVFTTG